MCDLTNRTISIAQIFTMYCCFLFFSFFLKKIIIAFCKGKSFMRIINENPLNCFATSHVVLSVRLCVPSKEQFLSGPLFKWSDIFEKCQRLDQTSWLPVKKSGVKFASLPDKFLLRRVQWGANWTVLNSFPRVVKRLLYFYSLKVNSITVGIFFTLHAFVII